MPTKLSNDGLRKAAILVASLDTAAADAVLDQLAPEQARQVREIVVELEDIDQSEQRRVIDEFFHRESADPQSGHPAAQDAGVELDGRLAWIAAGNDVPQFQDEPARRSPPAQQPFRFLQDAEADKLVRALTSERPQTIALVLSHLPPTRAGSVLAKLPEKVQVEVVHRLVELEEADPEILREVEEALRGRLSEHVPAERRRVAGLQAVAGILQATDGRTGIRILDNLARGDRTLAERLMPRQLAFDDLADLDADVLAEAVDEAGPELMLPALLGAAPELIGRVLACLPAAEARALGHKLDHPGPIRLRDVEEARRQVARIASRVSYCEKS
jgi:flagellar motor switch protein FliG